MAIMQQLEADMMKEVELFIDRQLPRTKSILYEIPLLTAVGRD